MRPHPAAVYARPKPGDPDLVHVICCEYESVSLCGLDVTDIEVIDDDTPTGCVVCAELENEATFCPVKGPKGCLP
jgi:hypothetical protein